MAGAMIKGLITASFIEAKNILVVDVIQSRLDELHSEYKVRVTKDSREVVSKSDVVILAVKPQLMQKVLEGIADLKIDKKLFRPSKTVSLVGDTKKAKKILKYKVKTNLDELISIMMDNDLSIEKNEN